MGKASSLSQTFSSSSRVGTHSLLLPPLKTAPAAPVVALAQRWAAGDPSFSLSASLEASFGATENRNRRARNGMQTRPVDEEKSNFLKKKFLFSSPVFFLSFFFPLAPFSLSLPVSLFLSRDSVLLASLCSSDSLFDPPSNKDCNSDKISVLF